MKNWKTTLIGVVMAMLNMAATLYQTGTADIQTIVVSAALAGLGILAKDFDAPNKTRK